MIVQKVEKWQQWLNPFYQFTSHLENRCKDFGLFKREPSQRWPDSSSQLQICVERELHQTRGLLFRHTPTLRLTSAGIGTVQRMNHSQHMAVGVSFLLQLFRWLPLAETLTLFFLNSFLKTSLCVLLFFSMGRGIPVLMRHTVISFIFVSTCSRCNAQGRTCPCAARVREAKPCYSWENSSG